MKSSSRIITPAAGFCAGCGRRILFTLRVLTTVCTTPPAPRLIISQFYRTGVQTLPIVCIIAGFVGGNIALQGYYTFSQFGGQNFIAIFITLATLREMAPIVAGAMTAARAGTAMSSEIATMRIKGQIDALRVMAIDPYRQLAVPRLFAAFLALPLLVLFADFVAMACAYVVAVHQFGLDSGFFMAQVTAHARIADLFLGMAKGAVFGVIIGLLCCYEGFFAHPGPEGVGRATNRAVVSVCIACSVMNYIMSQIMYG